MTNFICTIEDMNEMLSIVNSIPLPTTKLEVFNNGIKFAFESNMDDWFQIVKCVDGNFDLQVAYENAEGLQVSILGYGNTEDIKERLKQFIPGLASPDLDEDSKKLETVMSTGNYVINETEDNLVLLITE